MRRVVRVCVWGLGSVLALAAGLLLVNSFDEPLRPEVRAALEPPAEPYVPGRNLLYALMGFGSPEADFEAAGRRLEQTLVQADSPGNPLKARFGDLDQPHLDLVEESSLPPLGDLAASFAAWHGPRGANILSGNRVLMQRYEALRRYPFYARVLPSRMPMWMQPDWGYPVGAVRVRQVWFAQLLDSGQAAAVVRELHDDAVIWRRVLGAAQTSVLDKSFAATLVRADFAIAGSVIRRYPLQSDDYARLRELAAPVSDAERSVASLVGPELSATYAGLRFSSESAGMDSEDEPSPWFDPIERRFFFGERHGEPSVP